MHRVFVCCQLKRGRPCHAVVVGGGPDGTDLVVLDKPCTVGTCTDNIQPEMPVKIRTTHCTLEWWMESETRLFWWQCMEKWFTCIRGLYTLCPAFPWQLTVYWLHRLIYIHIEKFLKMFNSRKAALISICHKLWPCEPMHALAELGKQGNV